MHENVHIRIEEAYWRRNWVMPQDAVEVRMTSCSVA